MSANSIPQLDGVIDLGTVIGEGTFSTVYGGVFHPKYAANSTIKHLAIKCLTPIVEAQTLENELRCLTILEGKMNVIQLLFAVRHNDTLALVMPFFEHEKFCRLIRRFKPPDVRDYMRQLLLAMSHIHSHNIIHRDIKPNNFLYSTKTKKCALVDFGLAQICTASDSNQQNDTTESRPPLEDITVCNNTNGRLSLSDKPKKRKSEEFVNTKRKCNCPGRASVCRMCVGEPAIVAARAGTAGYRPPEVLLKCVDQSTAVDMWACGVILLSVLSGRPNFFNAPDDLNNLLQLVKLFGKEAVCAAADKMGKNLIVDVAEAEPKLSLKGICEALRHSAKKGFKGSRREVTVFPDSAYDLLEKLLALVPSERITACQALNHKFITSEERPTDANT